MWSLDDYRRVFMAVGLIAVIIFSVPSAMMFVHLPGGERFSELYVLGPSHMADGYPSSVSAGVEYSVYLGVVNHMGNSAYYGVYVKFRNASESLPNTRAGLYNYSVFLSDGQTWERPLNFSFGDVHARGASVGFMDINGAPVNVNKTAVWDNVNSGFFYQVFVELWIFNATSNSFGFHNRFVSLLLNMTAPS